VIYNNKYLSSVPKSKVSYLPPIAINRQVLYFKTLLN